MKSVLVSSTLETLFLLVRPLWLKLCDSVKQVAADWSGKAHSITLLQVSKNLNDQVPNGCAHVSAQRRFLCSYSAITMDSIGGLYSHTSPQCECTH